MRFSYCVGDQDVTVTVAGVANGLSGAHRDNANLNASGGSELWEDVVQ